MDVSRLRTGEKVAGISGVALLLIMFIFDWFTVDAGGGVFELSIGGNAWDTMELIRFVLLLAALAGIALAVMSAMASNVSMPVAMSAITAGLGILAVLLVLYRIIDPPGGDAEELGVEVNRAIGVFLGLIAAAGVAYGGWRAMQEEGTSFSGQADRLQDRSGGPGPGSGGGPGGTAPRTETAPPPSTTPTPGSTPPGSTTPGSQGPPPPPSGPAA